MSVNGFGKYSSLTSSHLAGIPCVNSKSINYYIMKILKQNIEYRLDKIMKIISELEDNNPLKEILKNANQSNTL